MWAPLYDRAMARVEREILGPRRAGLLGELEGDVLDVGAGTGVNLQHFGPGARVVAAEPGAGMRRRLEARVAGAAAEVEVVDAAAESLPHASSSFDAVVFTCVLCSVRDVDAALAEARRVLKPAGRLIVLEHVRGTGSLARWQDRIAPIWSRLAGGCHPNREIGAAVQAAGFAFERSETFDPFPRLVPVRPMLEGVAVARATS